MIDARQDQLDRGARLRPVRRHRRHPAPARSLRGSLHVLGALHVHRARGRAVGAAPRRRSPRAGAPRGRPRRVRAHLRPEGARGCRARPHRRPIWTTPRPRHRQAGRTKDKKHKKDKKDKRSAGNDRASPEEVRRGARLTRRGPRVSDRRGAQRSTLSRCSLRSAKRPKSIEMNRPSASAQRRSPPVAIGREERAVGEDLAPVHLRRARPTHAQVHLQRRGAAVVHGEPSGHARVARQRLGRAQELVEGRRRCSRRARTPADPRTPSRTGLGPRRLRRFDAARSGGQRVGPTDERAVLEHAVWVAAGVGRLGEALVDRPVGPGVEPAGDLRELVGHLTDRLGGSVRGHHAVDDGAHRLGQVAHADPPLGHLLGRGGLPTSVQRRRVAESSASDAVARPGRVQGRHVGVGHRPIMVAQRSKSRPPARGRWASGPCGRCGRRGRRRCAAASRLGGQDEIDAHALALVEVAGPVVPPARTRPPSGTRCRNTSTRPQSCSRRRAARSGSLTWVASTNSAMSQHVGVDRGRC